jgi:hypothetical protein
MSREFLIFQQEKSFMTPQGASTGIVWPTSSPNTFYARLTGGDSFTMRPRLAPVTIPYGGGFATAAFTVNDKLICEGRYTTDFYAGPFGKFLLGWATSQIDAAGTGTGTVSGTYGWTYTGLPGNLATCSIWHAILQGNGGWKCRLYLGVMVKSWSFTISEQSTIGSFTMDLVGAKAQGNNWDTSVDPVVTGAAGAVPTYPGGSSASVIGPPANNNLPTVPYVFAHASGGLTLEETGSATPTRTTFQSLSMSCQNMVMSRFWANRFVQFLQMCGRKATFSASNFLVSTSPDDREGPFEQNLPTTVTLIMNAGAGLTTTFTLNTANIITSIEDSLPLADIYTQTMTCASAWDPTATPGDAAYSADFVVSFS